MCQPVRAMSQAATPAKPAEKSPAGYYREGYGYVEINRTGLYPRTYLMTPEEDPEERRNGMAKFMEPFDGKLVRIRVEVVSPEEEKRLREEDRKVRAEADEEED